MIKYNNNTINDLNFDTSNVIKVYRNNAIVFYKISGESPTPEYKVCFAVVDDISEYTDREFEDVYDNATEKWYKLNNLNQYEAYGVYGQGTGSTVTTYDGKLTIDDGYEYEWNGSSWVNIGEIEEGESRLPQGYTEVEYVQHSNDVHTNINVFWTVPNDGVSGNVYTVDLSLDSNQSGNSRYIQLFGSTYGYCYRQDSGYRYNVNVGYMTKLNYTNSYAPPYDTKLRYRLEPLELTVTNTVASTSVTINLTSNRSTGSGGTDFGVFNANMYDGGAYCLKGKIYSILIEDSNGVIKHNYVPCKRDNDNVIGLYDIIGNSFYSPSVLIVTAGEEVVKKTYPKYYSEKSEPLDNLTFNTLAEAKTYAKANCVYDGMKATIDGDRYYFDSSDENGWVKITEHYDELEYIQCGNGTTTTNGGLQLLTNVTADYYFEVEAQCVMRGTSPMLIGEKSSVEVVSYQLGLCYYSSMFLDYGGGRLSTNINSTTQNQRHTYGAGHISGSSNPNVVGLKLDGVVQNTTNATTRVEGLPYLVGCGVGYTGHSASDVSVGTSNTDVVKLYSIKIYKDYGDTLVGDYIPVINSDNVVTLYDKVSGNYATPYGTLIAGPIV